MPTRLACGTTANVVMAGITVTRGAAIMHPGPANKRRGRMTDMAVERCRQMCGMLAFGDAAIMTTGTVIHDARVIKDCTGKGRCIVADATILNREHMVYRFSRRESCPVAA